MFKWILPEIMGIQSLLINCFYLVLLGSLSSSSRRFEVSIIYGEGKLECSGGKGRRH